MHRGTRRWMKCLSNSAPDNDCHASQVTRLSVAVVECFISNDWQPACMPCSSVSDSVLSRNHQFSFKTRKYSSNDNQSCNCDNSLSHRRHHSLWRRHKLCVRSLIESQLLTTIGFDCFCMLVPAYYVRTDEELIVITMQPLTPSLATNSFVNSNACYSLSLSGILQSRLIVLKQLIKCECKPLFFLFLFIFLRVNEWNRSTRERERE